MTIAVVRLSSAAERKKVTKPTTTTAPACRWCGYGWSQLKTTVCIHEFYYGHGAEQEEEDAGGLRPNGGTVPRSR